MRYVHPSDADVDEAVVKAREARSGHTSRHTQEMAEWETTPKQQVIN